MKPFKAIMVFLFFSLLSPAVLVVACPWLSAWIEQFGYYRAAFTNIEIALINIGLAIVCLIGMASYMILLRAGAKRLTFNLVCSVIGVAAAALLAFFAPSISGHMILPGLNIYYTLAISFFFLLILRIVLYDLVLAKLKKPVAVQKP